jgi:class 3 adenylate cyclase/alpha-beta hydrolase superfamily lysophospholipase
MTPETRYARTVDGTHVAYQVTGAGPVDILYLRAWHTDIDHEWADPVLARKLRRLGAMGRLIRLDRRGMGMSDRFDRRVLPTVEDRLDDISAVLDAVGARRVVLAGFGDGTALTALFAAMRPERTQALVLYEPLIRWRYSDDYPWGYPPEEWAAYLDSVRRGWATRELAAGWIAGGAPSRAKDERFVDWLVEHQARSGTAEDAVAVLEVLYETDAVAALPAIHLPTLVVAREMANGDMARWVAERIDGAQLVLLPGNDHFAIAGDTDAVLREIERFIAGVVEPAADDVDADADRALVTLLFADIVDSTRTAAEIGDRRWSELVERHHRESEALVDRHRGRVVDVAGDGLLASFDGPGRAIRCARALVDGVRDLGLELRTGLHAGECERVGDRLRGLAVHIGARVAGLAAPSEVLVSSTVKDLVAGSGLEFEDRGEHELKGVPGEWRVFAVR